MVCLACAAIGYPLCETCTQRLRLAHPRTVGGLTVHAAYVHTGTAARLVHNLKYRGSLAAGRFLAKTMADRIPSGVHGLVPVPRARWRRIAHGVDQTAVLAGCMSDVTGLPVVDALVPPVWHRRLAGSDRKGRRPPQFGLRFAPTGVMVIVDDVCTTGLTLSSAARSLASDDLLALVATSAPEPETVG